MHIALEEKFLEAAKQIGEDLMAESEELSDGSLTWNREREAVKNSQFVSDSGIYNGRCGEAFFFAALYKATDNQNYKNIALRTLAGITRGVGRRKHLTHLVREIGVGLAGVGGILYSAVRIAQFAGRSGIGLVSENIISSLSRDLLSGCGTDVFRGLAGLILGVLTLKNVDNLCGVSVVEALGDRLLQHRITDDVSRYKTWQTHKGKPLAGFAHGSAGIACALLRLYQYTGLDRFYEAAFEAFAFERSLYRNHLSNWPLMRDQLDSKATLCAWCRGAAGVGIGRLSAIECVRSEQETVVAKDLKNAIEGTLNNLKSKEDSVCCGNFGRIDFLLEAGVKLKNGSLIKRAREKGSERIANAREGGYMISHGAEGASRVGLGFWRGKAGIGYTLLRLSSPSIFPCALSLD